MAHNDNSVVGRREQDLIDEVYAIRLKDPTGAAAHAQQAYGYSEESILRLCVVGLYEVKEEQMRQLKQYVQVYGVLKE